jgi:hypothetical protein
MMVGAGGWSDGQNHLATSTPAGMGASLRSIEQVAFPVKLGATKGKCKPKLKIGKDQSCNAGYATFSEMKYSNLL